MGQSEEFAVTVSQRADCAMVEVQGELDAATGPTLVDAVSALTRNGLHRRGDRSRRRSRSWTPGDSARCLESHREATERDMTLRVVNPQPAVAKLFRITGIDAVLLDGEAST